MSHLFPQFPLSPQNTERFPNTVFNQRPPQKTPLQNSSYGFSGYLPGTGKLKVPGEYGEEVDDLSHVADYFRHPFVDFKNKGIHAYMSQGPDFGGQGFHPKTGAWMDNRPSGSKGYPTSRPVVGYNGNGIPSLGSEAIPSGEKSVGQQQTEYMNARGAPTAAQFSAHMNTVADQLRAGTFNGGQGPQAASYGQQMQRPQLSLSPDDMSPQFDRNSIQS